MDDTNWIGKVCPYCEKRLLETDHVKVCDRCGIPYHATCWCENKGCKFHDGFGRPYERSAPPPPAGEAFFCPDCGTKVSPDAQFCLQCGHHVAGRVRRGPDTGRRQDIGDDFYNFRYHLEREYIGAKEDCYLDKFSRLRSRGSSIGWNWCAFLFGPFWFLYRKMYSWAAVFWLAPTLVRLVLPEELGWLVSLAGWILGGLLGDSLYMRQIDKNVDIGSRLPEPMRYQHISKRSGVNLPALIITLVVWLLLMLWLFSETMRLLSGIQ